MPTLITIRPNFVVPALLEIANPDFATSYSHGVFWALYGDYQGNGPYEDRYLIDNISRNIQAGRYDNPNSSELPPAGFYFGMLHGGVLEPGSHQLRPNALTLVDMTEWDFSRGYFKGRRFPLKLTDAVLMHALHSFARDAITAETLWYKLGRLTGSLSVVLIPAMVRL